MATHINVHGKEITHPWHKVLLATFIILLTAGIGAAVVSLVLTLVGVLVTAAFVLTGIVVIAVLLAVLLLVLGGSALSMLLAPFALLWHAIIHRKKL